MLMETSPQREVAQAIVEKRDEAVAAILVAVYRDSPGAWDRFGESGRAHCRKDVGYHLDYLEQSLRFGDPGIFGAYIDWLERLFAGLGFSKDSLPLTLAALESGLGAVLKPAAASIVRSTLAAARSRESAATEDMAQPSIGFSSPLKAEAATYLDSLLAGDRLGATNQIMACVREGVPLKSIYLDIFQASQYELGHRWLSGNITIAQEHFCTAATQVIMSRLYPTVFATPRNGKRLVAASVGGELHELGIRMVADLFELEGWDSYYLGANSPPSSIVEALRSQGAQLLCLSATMVWHLPGIESVLRLVREAFPAEKLHVIVGGAPFNLSPGLWKEIGADGYASDAVGAIRVGNQLVPGPAIT
jgi:methanogenic corrinoid protein MtbC1